MLECNFVLKLFSLVDCMFAFSSIMVYMDIFICTLHLLRFQNIVLVPFMSRFGDKTD